MDSMDVSLTCRCLGMREGREKGREKVSESVSLYTRPFRARARAMGHARSPVALWNLRTESSGAG